MESHRIYEQILILIKYLKNEYKNLDLDLILDSNLLINILK